MKMLLYCEDDVITTRTYYEYGVTTIRTYYEYGVIRIRICTDMDRSGASHP